jgi:guanyl-specific ribonuclease Sa
MTPEIKRDIRTAAVVVLCALAFVLLTVGQCCRLESAESTAQQAVKSGTMPAGAAAHEAPRSPNSSQALRSDAARSSCRGGACPAPAEHSVRRQTAGAVFQLRRFLFFKR